MKAILRAAIGDARTNRKTVAEAIGVPNHYLCDALNDSEPQRFPADLLVPFMQATTLGPLRHLAQQMRCAVIQLPEVDAAGVNNAVIDKALRTVESLGESIREIRASLADGRMTELEASNCERELNETIDILFSLLLDIRALVPKRTPARMTTSQASAPAAEARHA